VSSSLGGSGSVVFGVIPNDDQVKDDEAAEIIGKSPNLIGFGAKLAEEAFQQIG
jgi:hypothetical protein